jgi:hypothetical protein
MLPTKETEDFLALVIGLPHRRCFSRAQDAPNLPRP